MEMFNQFHEVIKDPADYAGKWKQKHRGNIIGSFCSYTPEEIILAAGALCYRIFGTDTEPFLADTHLQVYSCSLVRGALEEGLSGKLDFLDGVVFPHTCDSIQRLSDIWRMNIRMRLHADVVLPVKLDTPSARQYMIGVLNNFRCELESSLNLEITDEALKEAAVKYNQIRTELKKIYEVRRKHPELISGPDMYAVVKAAMIMDRDVLLDSLSLITRELDDKSAGARSHQKRLVLSGGICNMPDIYRLIEDSGGAVVWDDLCTGRRYVEGSTDTDGDIIEAIAQRYAQRVVCPAKHSGLWNRGEQLIKIVEENQAQGVIFLHLKFCDPHAFDYPYIKQMLENEGVPSMLLEIEGQRLSEGQFRTRIEAFMDML
jgi:bzd-type benzoyl-CoA reductase N subunit